MVIPFVSTATLGFWAFFNEDFFISFTTSNWIIFYSLAVIAMSFGIASTTFIAFLGGFFLSWTALPYTLVTYLLASYFGFLLANYIDQGKFIHTISKLPKAEGFLKGLQADQFGIIVMARISPVLPFAVINVVLSIIGVKLIPFLIAGVIGILPRLLLFIWLGFKATSLKEMLFHHEDHQFQTSFLIFFIISLVGILYYIRKILKNKSVKKA